MSEDAKSKLNEKKGAAVSDEDLENVAGGSVEQSEEILNALKRMDPVGVQRIYDAMEGYEEDRRTVAIYEGMFYLLKENFEAMNIPLKVFVSSKNNRYEIDGSPVTHEDILRIIDSNSPKN